MDAPAEPVGVPLMVHLAGQRVLVVGAGEVAAAKVARLLDSRARVTLVAPEATDALRHAVEDGHLSWRDRPYTDGDLDGVLLAVAATASAEVNAAVAREAAERGVLCVRSDAGGRATADFIATLRRGPLTLAVSTDGQAPSLARRLRGELAESYGPEFGELAALLGELRADPAVQERLAELDAEQRAARWRSILDTDILSYIRQGDAEGAKRLAVGCLYSFSG
jgi:precorrin-2 dehydrogenase/sirohydrochlorin ferrochelatase